jgi:hypothetical protein
MSSERSEQGILAKPQFVKVAEIIAKGPPPFAKGPPPDWLIPALQTWSRAIASGFQVTPALHREYKKRIAKMQEAVETLLVGLPKFYELPGDWACDDVIAEYLGELKAYFDRLSAVPKGGRKPHFGRKLCADFVVSYWKRIHGKASPRSDNCYEACEQYWVACGGEPSSDIQNWRDMVRDAAEREEPFLLQHILIFMIGGGIELGSK